MSGLSILEIAACAFTLLSVVLTVRQHIVAWPTAIIGVALYGIVFWQSKLYADMGLQGVYVALSIYGWYEWLHGGENRSELHVTRASPAALVRFILAGIFLAALLGTLLRHATDAALPWVDSSLTAFSLVAQWMMTKKYIQNWIIWISVDIVYIGMFIFKKLYVTSGLYVVFIFLCILGYREWRRSMPVAGS